MKKVKIKKAPKKENNKPNYDVHIVGPCQCGQGQCYYWTDGSTNCGL
jgi:hypothetical protein